MSIICGRTNKLIKKDKIEIEYNPKGEVLSRLKVLESNNYEIWYEHTYDSFDGIINNINIQSLNIRIGNINYKNVNNISINNNKSYMGIYDGYCIIEKS